MKVLINILVGLVALQHFGFLYLEMFLWDSPVGMKVFKLDPEFAVKSAAIAANQGLYNGFLAAGLLWSVVSSNALFARQLKIFFLGCVLVAGLYGFYSVSQTILYVQAIPAAIVLTLVLFFNHTNK